ncbi:MAG: D-alanyl-D-alanine carboxypeptidase [Candidatus Colwellbacteria bacterium]|nr:D-alanyl-D-alanine carboxypeptidase [Candidatus Colwellbacteria bacterium]MBI4058913.1 D-alanyl-D-alanine carboxypeptidase [Candidatus Microgenomates bacterium]
MKLPIFPLAFLVLLLTSTSVLVTPLEKFPRKLDVEVPVAAIPIANNEPVPKISAQAAFIYDPLSAVVLYDKNGDIPLAPASTTKIMTALVALDNYNLQEVVTVPKIKVTGQKMNLIWGEQLTIENLLQGLLIFSANDAGEVLASHFSGGREAFIAAMNEKAVDLHLAQTHFLNPTGIFMPGHQSSAQDLARLANFAMANSVLAQIVATRHELVTSQTGQLHDLFNLNILLGTVPGVIGVKTGKTDEGGEALVTYVKRDGGSVLIVVLGSQDRFGDTKALIDWVYRTHQWQEPLAAVYFP